MVISERLYSADEFWELTQLPENAGKRLELVNGEVREMVPAGGEHGEIAFDFGLLVGNYVKQHHLGRVTAAETGYILHTDVDGKDTVRAPDIGFVRLERAPEPFTEKFVPLAPDLAIEVVSPGDKAHEIEEKVLDYLTYGVHVVWIVYPSSRTIVIHTVDGLKRLTVKDTLEGGDILPGFKIAVSEIFPTK
jgi:Uma2 family endonuclease